MPKPRALPCRILGFEAPVRHAAVVEVNWEATAGGITLKLERATDSPGQAEALLRGNESESRGRYLEEARPRHREGVGGKEDAGWAVVPS